MAHEIFAPSHTAVWFGLPCRAAEAAAVNHHHWKVLIAIDGHLVLNVHLIDRNITGLRDHLGRAGLSDPPLLAPDEEAALLLNDKRNRLLR